MSKLNSSQISLGETCEKEQYLEILRLLTTQLLLSGGATIPTRDVVETCTNSSLNLYHWPRNIPKSHVKIIL